MRLAVLGDVLEAEAAWQREIELHRGELPEPADGVHQLDVDLGPIESGFVLHDFHLQLQPLRGFGERILGQLPLIGRAVILAAHAVVPSGKLGFVTVEAVGFERVESEL